MSVKSFMGQALGVSVKQASARQARNDSDKHSSLLRYIINKRPWLFLPVSPRPSEATLG